LEEIGSRPWGTVHLRKMKRRTRTMSSTILTFLRQTKASKATSALSITSSTIKRALIKRSKSILMNPTTTRNQFPLILLGKSLPQVSPILSKKKTKGRTWMMKKTPSRAQKMRTEIKMMLIW